MSVLALIMALLLFPLHACSARHSFAFVSFTKDAEVAKLHEIENKLNFLSNIEEDMIGGKTKSSATLDDDQSFMIMKDFTRQARSMVEFASNETKKHAHHANEGKTTGDVVLADYQPPSGNPPIHNPP